MLRQPELCSLLLWRNLGGWPVGGPYRSIAWSRWSGGRATSAAQEDLAARLDADSRADWSLTVSAGAS